MMGASDLIFPSHHNDTNIVVLPSTHPKRPGSHLWDFGWHLDVPCDGTAVLPDPWQPSDSSMDTCSFRVVD